MSKRRETYLCIDLPLNSSTNTISKQSPFLERATYHRARKYRLKIFSGGENILAPFFFFFFSIGGQLSSTIIDVTLWIKRGRAAENICWPEASQGSSLVEDSSGPRSLRHDCWDYRERWGEKVERERERGGNEGLKRTDDRAAWGRGVEKSLGQNRKNATGRKYVEQIALCHGGMERPPFVGLPFPCLVGCTRTVRGTFLDKSVASVQLCFLEPVGHPPGGWKR